MNAQRVDLYSSYQSFTGEVMSAVRRETFGVDIGQNSWMTVDEFDQLLCWLDLTNAAEARVLEVACGSGGPALHLAKMLGCCVTGIDVEQHAIDTATRMADATGLVSLATFMVADANARLPFDDDEFDGLVCIDAMNHLHDRPAVLREWRRVLRPGCKAVFTDPVVITGTVIFEQLAIRSSIGPFLFAPAGENERLIAQAGLRLLHSQDLSDGAAAIADRWRKARENHRAELEAMEGPERFANLQQFFESVHRLTSLRQLSRLAYVVEKAA